MKADKRGYIYLGAEFANQEFEPVPQKDGRIVLNPVVTVKVSKEDAWFLSSKWQKNEKAVEGHIRDGNVVSEVSVTDLLTQMKTSRKKVRK